MAPEIILAVAVAIVVALAVFAKIAPKRNPPSPVFKCSRCDTAARHNDRTAEAWRNGKTKFFCQSCHAKWLQSRPPQEREHASRSSGDGSSGCLGVVVLFALLPLGCLVFWAYA